MIVVKTKVSSEVQCFSSSDSPLMNNVASRTNVNFLLVNEEDVISDLTAK